jgi:hypothetical protein
MVNMVTAVTVVNIEILAVVNMVVAGAGATTIRITIGGTASTTLTVIGCWTSTINNGYGIVNGNDEEKLMIKTV